MAKKTKTPAAGPVSGRWVALPSHRAWLLDEATSLFRFFERRSINPAGGFFVLDDRGEPIARSKATGKAPAREIHVDDAHGALLRHRRA